MKSDPADYLNAVNIEWPRTQGAGSGKAAWVDFARTMAKANGTLWDTVNQQRETIRDLQAEVRLLRQEAASRKPKGGRERLPDETVNKIERALEAGHSTRRIGEAYGVSAMTVSRVRKRMQERATA